MTDKGVVPTPGVPPPRLVNALPSYFTSGMPLPSAMQVTPAKLVNCGISQPAVRGRAPIEVNAPPARSQLKILRLPAPSGAPASGVTAKVLGLTYIPISSIGWVTPPVASTLVPSQTVSAPRCESRKLLERWIAPLVILKRSIEAITPFRNPFWETTSNGIYLRPCLRPLLSLVGFICIQDFCPR